METGKPQLGAGLAGRETVQCPSSHPSQDEADCDLGALEETMEQHVGARRDGGAELLTLLGSLSTPRPRAAEILQHARGEESAPKCPQLGPREPCSEVPHGPSSPPSGSSTSFSLMPDGVGGGDHGHESSINGTRQRAQRFPCISSISILTESTTVPF